MQTSFDHRTWRSDLLPAVLRIALVVGIPVYAFSVSWAWVKNLHGIILVDTAVLALIIIVWWFDRWPYRLRAFVFCLSLYLLGTLLLAVAGLVGQLYLVGHSAMSAVFLGLRYGIASVAINTLSLLTMALAGLMVWEMPPAGWTEALGTWVLVAANFMLVASLVTVVIGLVLGRLDDALEREISARGALREREQRLRTLIDATPDAVMVLRSDTALQEANPAALRLLQIGDMTEDEARLFERYVVPEDADAFHELHRAVLAGQGGQREIRLRRANHRDNHRDNRRDNREELIVDLVSAPLELEAGRILHLAIARDVTGHRQLQEQLRQAQRLDAIGKLTGGIAHDFNNLLTVILGNSELLIDSLADRPDLQQLADTSRSTAEKGAALTQRLLAFSRQQTLSPRLVDIGRRIAEMEPLLRRSLGEDIEIRINGAGRRAVAEVDPHQLENAVLNLCINARDAMPGGGKLELDVRLRRFDAGAASERERIQPGRYVALTVTDTGEGMDEAVASRAFEPFFTTKEIGKGTGLGLSMVHGFVEQSHGQVRIESCPGRGTLISLYLPASNEDADAQEVVESALPGGSECILIVEDNAEVREHVQNQLTKLGYEVVVAVNAAEALERLRSDHHFDLVFSDVVMPGEFNGRDLAEKSARLRPGLPVLLTSGYTQNSIFPDGRLPAGMRLLNKPYRRSELAHCLREMLEKAS